METAIAIYISGALTMLVVLAGLFVRVRKPWR